MAGNVILENRILVVVAHPDDEILWLSPLVPEAATVLAALPIHADKVAITNGRELVRANYPLKNFEFLPLREAGAFRRSDWLRREPIEQGVTLRKDCPEERARAYFDNYALLLDALKPYVSSHQVIFSHNLWGEYGHEDHVQVARAVVSLARSQGKSVWAWDGFSTHRLLANGMRLRQDFYRNKTRHLPRLRLDVDISLFRDVRQLYRSHGAWTWLDDSYEPSRTSNYIQLVRDGNVLVAHHPVSRHREFRIATRSAVHQSNLRIRHKLQWTMGHRTSQ
jgi:LmbE family N-acetylglucosaminyl deacetylase